MSLSMLMLLLGSFLLAIGCGKEEKSEEVWEKGPAKSGDKTGEPPAGIKPGGSLGDRGSSGQGQPGGGESGVPPADGSLALAGIWVSPCFADKSGKTSSADYYNFDESGKVVQVVIFYKSGRCSADSELFAAAPVGTYQVGEIAEGLMPLDIHVKDQFVVLYDPVVVAEFNRMGYYGYTDWVVKQRKSVMGRTDPEGGQVRENIFYNNIKFKDGKLLMSQFSADPTQRSKKIVDGVSYVKRSEGLLYQTSAESHQAEEKIRVL